MAVVHIATIECLLSAGRSAPLCKKPDQSELLPWSWQGWVRLSLKVLHGILGCVAVATRWGHRVKIWQPGKCPCGWERSEGVSWANTWECVLKGGFQRHWFLFLLKTCHKGHENMSLWKVSLNVWVQRTKVVISFVYSSHQGLCRRGLFPSCLHFMPA